MTSKERKEKGPHQRGTKMTRMGTRAAGQKSGKGKLLVANSYTSSFLLVVMPLFLNGEVTFFWSHFGTSH